MENKKMSRGQTSNEILELINSKGTISITELAEKTFRSPSTVRRELNRLEGQGLIRRHHGGAESTLHLNPPQIVRRHRNQAEKNALAKKAAALVFPGSTIFIDASTTVHYMIPYLSTVERLTVYTNGADTAIRLAEAKIRTVSTGGEMAAESMAYIGKAAEATVRKIYFDAMFFSSAGFDDEVINIDEEMNKTEEVKEEKKPAKRPAGKKPNNNRKPAAPKAPEAKPAE